MGGESVYEKMGWPVFIPPSRFWCYCFFPDRSVFSKQAAPLGREAKDPPLTLTQDRKDNKGEEDSHFIQVLKGFPGDRGRLAQIAQ